jgi:hypothetical protein
MDSFPRLRSIPNDIFIFLSPPFFLSFFLFSQCPHRQADPAEDEFPALAPRSVSQPVNAAAAAAGAFPPASAAG